ncbi:type VI secretion system tip protein VgrG, partial [Pseudomonas sp. YuFO20]|nr:type VI secretion system tip protein VgrG [Pseudomonas sp. YuFO20]
MSNTPRIFFNQTRHKFAIRWFDAVFDVLAFEGEEHLSQPFSYRIEFTCTEQDLSAEQMLNKDACFSLYPSPPKPPYPGFPAPEYKPLRSLYGMVNN